jgi:MFS transporter, putative metabolite:H+ symporter
MNNSSTPFTKPVIALIFVSALGYFVDVFDILLFSVVRTASLRDLGVPMEELLNVGVNLINAQMFGMLLGGVLWGIYGDKKGRLSVLFGSILVYSLANILNGMVQTTGQYAFLRFIAGLGLAGELGAGITLVAEALPKDKRGLGTTIIAATGVAGGLVASIVTKFWDWREAYFIAGGLGLILLALRVSVHESKLFQKTQTSPQIERGSLKLLFASRERIAKLFFCIWVGVPIYFVLGILVTFAPEIGMAKGLEQTLTAGDAVFYSYVGFILGDLGSGLLSQFLKNRRKVILLFTALTTATSLILLLLPSLTLGIAHILYILIGLFAGYWAVVATVAAEQFGTNLRSTVTTSVPNLIRGAVIPLTLLTKALIPGFGLIWASSLVLFLVAALAIFSALQLKETFSVDLDRIES